MHNSFSYENRYGNILRFHQGHKCDICSTVRLTVSTLPRVAVEPPRATHSGVSPMPLFPQESPYISYACDMFLAMSLFIVIRCYGVMVSQIIVGKLFQAAENARLLREKEQSEDPTASVLCSRGG